MGLQEIFLEMAALMNNTTLRCSEKLPSWAAVGVILSFGLLRKKITVLMKESCLVKNLCPKLVEFFVTHILH